MKKKKKKKKKKTFNITDLYNKDFSTMYYKITVVVVVGFYDTFLTC